MGSGSETPVAPKRRPAPLRSNKLWWLRIALWLLAAGTFAWERIASSRLFPYPDTEVHRRWIWPARVDAYQDSLSASVVIAPSIVLALLVLSIVSFWRREPGAAMLDLCVIPVLLAWAILSFFVLGMGFT
jgi:hypothetical protein